MKAKKTLIIILVFSLALGLLSACGGEKQSEKSYESDFVYLPKYTKIEITDKNMQLGHVSAKLGDKILISAIERFESDENAEELEIKNISYIYSFNMENPKLEKLPSYEPLVISELGEGDFSIVTSDISNISADKNGNIFIIETYYAAGMNEDGESKQGSFIRKLDSAGKELLRVETESLIGSEEKGFLQGIILSPEGKLCLISAGEGSKLIFADENLKPVGEKSLSDVGWISGSAQSAEGKTYLMYFGNMGGGMVSELDFEVKGIKKGMSLDKDAYAMYTGGGGFDLMVGDNANLYGVSAETGKTEYILNFVNSGIDMNNLRLLSTLENGDLLALTDNSMSYFLGGGGGSGENQSYEMIYLTKTPKEETPEVQTLTLAGIYIDGYMSQKILEFNKKSSELKIEVKDYSVFNTENDYMAGETKLLTEIGAGNVPDILCSQSSMHQSFIKKGLFIDLMPLIDADKELGGREALFAPVLKASLTDGKLYTLSAGFRHICCVAPSDLIPDKLVTFEAAKAAKAKLQENASYFDAYVNGPTFLNLAMVLNQGDFVDFENGTAMFDSNMFIDLLNLSKEMPTQEEKAMMYMEYEDPAIRVRDGKQLFMLLSNDSELLEYRMLSTLLNGKINFCSLPGADKVFSAFVLEGGLSISANCANPELAWKFVRTLVADVNTYEKDDVWGAFPMNAKSFENLINKLMEKQMIKDENGNEVEESRISMGTAGGENINIYALTAEQRDALMELFENTSVINEPDQKLMEIIGEETAAFFEGSKTAEETAKIIQNRASIYVSEAG